MSTDVISDVKDKSPKINADHAKQLIRIQDWMEKSNEVGHKDYYAFMLYRAWILSRKMLYNRFKDEDGNFRIDWMNKKDKTTLNNLSSKIWEYEMKFTSNPIYDKIVAEFEEDLPEFLRDTNRDSKGRWTELEVAQGWYQNSHGDLYHYDGVVWDNVPSEKVSDLEFLGS